MRLALALWTLLLAAGASLPAQAGAVPAKRKAARSRPARVASRSGLERRSEAVCAPRSARDAAPAPRAPAALAPAALPRLPLSSRLASVPAPAVAVSSRPASTRRGRAPPPAA
jgi:hypothetical protein